MFFLFPVQRGDGRRMSIFSFSPSWVSQWIGARLSLFLPTDARCTFFFPPLPLSADLGPSPGQILFFPFVQLFGHVNPMPFSPPFFPFWKRNKDGLPFSLSAFLVLRTTRVVGTAGPADFPFFSSLRFYNPFLRCG